MILSLLRNDGQWPDGAGFDASDDAIAARLGTENAG